MRPAFRNVALALGLTLPMAACARCAPATVSTGVSRLTMRNLGMLVELVNKDDRCGFEAPVVKDAVELSAPLGAIGTGTWRVEDCELEVPVDTPYVSKDCNGVETRAWGRVRVSAERRVSGIIAGDAQNPVIPGGPDAVTIDITRAVFSEFRVEASGSKNALTWRKGSISGRLAPRLAVDDNLGACSVVTGNAYLSQVRYGDASQVWVDTEERSFDVEVDDSSLFAINGQHSGRENDLWGAIDVWGSRYQVPNDVLGLDPAYDRQQFQAAYGCKQGLLSPQSFDCHTFLGPVLAQNAARLTMRLLGRVTTVLEADQRCGFSSPAVLDNVQLQGDVGHVGVATFRVDNCALHFAEPTIVATDCAGAPSRVHGRIVVSAIKRLEGRLTGNLTAPVVPMDDNPARFEITVDRFEDFEVSEAKTALRVKSGGLSGFIEPRVAANTADAGACSYVTDIARFADVRWTPSAITIIADKGTFDATVGRSDLRGVNGYWGGDTNLLRGTITLDGEDYRLPTDPNDDGLDPAYERERFDQAWQCRTLERPVRFDCAFDRPLAQGAAQLGVQTFGTLASLIDADTKCGFSSPRVVNAVRIEGAVGRDNATATYRIDKLCELSFPEATVVATDCNGIRTYAQGRARVTGRKTLAGINAGDPREPIVPTQRAPVTVDLAATLDDFAVWTDPGQNRLTVRSGQLSGAVSPRLAIDRTTGACSIPTPVAELRDIRFTGADLTLVQDDKRFDVRVDTSNLQAINGETETGTNQLTGTLTMDGERFAIPTEGEPVLNPSYDQQVFDRSYACLDNLVMPEADATSARTCNMKRTLGEGVARFLILAVGTLASSVNADEGCGFEDFWTLIKPETVEGDNGERGRLVWSIDDCKLSGSASTPQSTDCTGARRYIDGRFVVDARRTVVGKRDTTLIVFDSIIPDDRNAVTIDLLDARLSDFRVFDVRPGEDDAYRAFEIKRGRVAAIVEPITGENQDRPGTFDIATPVARFSAVRLLEGTRVKVFNAGKTFDVHVERAQLEAFNGSYREFGITNRLRGEIVIDGVTVAIDAPLDPSYEQATFDAAYACTPDLVAPISAQ